MNTNTDGLTRKAIELYENFAFKGQSALDDLSFGRVHRPNGRSITIAML